MQHEEQLTIACIHWMKMQHPKIPVMHIANERNTSPRRGAKLRRMGVRKGVADIFIPKPTANDCGLWIELKIDDSYPGARKTYPNKNQKRFLYQMHQAGFATAVCWNFDDFTQTVTAYLSGEPLWSDYLENVFEQLIEEDA